MVFLIVSVWRAVVFTSQALVHLTIIILSQYEVTVNKFFAVRSNASTAITWISLRMNALMLLLMVMMIMPKGHIQQKTPSNPISYIRFEIFANHIRLASGQLLFTLYTTLFVGSFVMLWIGGLYVDWEAYGWFLIETMIFKATGRTADMIKPSASTLTNAKLSDDNAIKRLHLASRHLARSTFLSSYIPPILGACLALGSVVTKFVLFDSVRVLVGFIRHNVQASMLSQAIGKISCIDSAVTTAFKLKPNPSNSNNPKRVPIVSLGASVITRIASTLRAAFASSEIGTSLVQLGIPIIHDNLGFVVYLAIICCIQVAGMYGERSVPSTHCSIRNNTDRKVVGSRVLPVNGVAPSGDKGDGFRRKEKKPKATSFARDKVSETAKRKTGFWLDQSSGAGFGDIPQEKNYKRGLQTASRGRLIDPFGTAPFDFENHLRPLYTSESIKVRTTRSQKFSELGKFGMRAQTRVDE